MKFIQNVKKLKITGAYPQAFQSTPAMKKVVFSSFYFLVLLRLSTKTEVRSFTSKQKPLQTEQSKSVMILSTSQLLPVI
jgi:hypothetical protein